MRRIVCSIAFFRQMLSVQLVFTSTKSRRKFYTQVERQSFHTASTQLGHGRAGLDFVAHRQIRKSTNCADPYRDSQRIGLQGLLAALHSALQHSIYSSRSLI
jgi:hypothetical protein